jgi:hypothetical protein
MQHDLAIEAAKPPPTPTAGEFNLDDDDDDDDEPTANEAAVREEGEANTTESADVIEAQEASAWPTGQPAEELGPQMAVAPGSSLDSAPTALTSGPVVTAADFVK